MAVTPTRAEIDDYIRRVFSAYGHNPEVAVKISQAEMMNPAVWKNPVSTAYGPFQLLTNGGLGDKYIKDTGLNPADPANWKRQVEWVAANLRTTSWEPWEVADKVLGGPRTSDTVKWTGINRVPKAVDLTNISEGTSTIGGVTKDGFSYVFPIPGWGGSLGDILGSYHTPGGSDLFAPEGTPIVSMIGGTVTGSGYDDTGGFFVQMTGQDGLTYYFAHMQENPLVKVGDRVEMGQQIGKVGQTGNADGTGAHLHIGIGYGIQQGKGKAGGTGIGFNAKGLLGDILQAGGAASVNIIDAVGGAIAPVGGLLDTIAKLLTNPLGVLGEQIAGGLSKGAATILQALANELKSRVVASAFLGIGIILLLVGLIGLVMASDNPVIEAAATAVPGGTAIKSVARAAR